MQASCIGVHIERVEVQCLSAYSCRRTPVFELLLVDQTPPVLVVDVSITSWSDASTVLKEGTCLALLFMRCVSTDGPWDSGSYDLVKQLLEKPLPLIKGVRSPDYREMIEHSFRVLGSLRNGELTLV